MEFSLSWKVVAKYQARKIAKYIEAYRLGRKTVGGGHLLVFVFDPSTMHPGLVDRIKAIVGAYYVAKTSNRDFRILFNDEFDLGKFLEPTGLDWRIDKSEMDYSICHSRIIDYFGLKVPKLNDNVLQYHIYNYMGWNILKRYFPNDWEMRWTTLYQELFTPTGLLKKQIEKVGIEENSYISVHFRFINALELTETLYPQQPLEGTERELLISRCLNFLNTIKKQEQLPVLVFSDSNEFQRLASAEGFKVIEGNIAHVGYDKSDDVLSKTLLDLYMISRSQKVYKINGEHLYQGAYAYYGALIGGKPFSIIEI